MKFKRKSNMDYTYYTTRVKKNWIEIIADINKMGDSYELSFCKPTDDWDIKDVKVIDFLFSDIERCKIYAECFMMWVLYA